MEEVWRVPRTGTTKEGFPGEWKVNTQGEGTQGEGTRGEGTRGRAPGGGDGNPGGLNCSQPAPGRSKEPAFLRPTLRSHLTIIATC